jgi:hypothetical protein
MIAGKNKHRILILAFLLSFDNQGQVCVHPSLAPNNRILLFASRLPVLPIPWQHGNRQIFLLNPSDPDNDGQHSGDAARSRDRHEEGFLRIKGVQELQA